MKLDYRKYYIMQPEVEYQDGGLQCNTISGVPIEDRHLRFSTSGWVVQYFLHFYWITELRKNNSRWKRRCYLVAQEWTGCYHPGAWVHEL